MKVGVYPSLVRRGNEGRSLPLLTKEGLREVVVYFFFKMSNAALAFFTPLP